MPRTREKPMGNTIVPGKKKKLKKVKTQNKKPAPPAQESNTIVPGKKKNAAAIKVKERDKKHPPKKVTRAKVFHFKDKDQNQYSLTIQQKEFCEYFCEFSMNGVDAIIKAGYNVTGKTGKIDYALAGSISRENLSKPAINAYINILLERYGLTDENVDRQLLTIINQNFDLGVKTRGIDIYYKKKGAYAPVKVEPGENISSALDRLSRLLPE